MRFRVSTIWSLDRFGFMRSGDYTFYALYGLWLIRFMVCTVLGLYGLWFIQFMV